MTVTITLITPTCHLQLFLDGDLNNKEVDDNNDDGDDDDYEN